MPIGDILKVKENVEYGWDNKAKSINLMIPIEAEITLTAGKDEFVYKSLGLPLCAGDTVKIGRAS